MHQFRKWAQKEYSLKSRLAGTLLAGIFFVFVMPLVLVTLGPVLDRSISIELPDLGIWPLLIGAGLMAIGGIFALWTIGEQLFRARGTPLPMMPTQELLVSGPFKLSRNPMSFGTMMLYLGLGIAITSPSAIAIVIILSVLLLSYIKKIEEQELEARFGQAYLDYKATTPFFFPSVKDRSPPE